jgi:hypothetical protein
MRHLGIVKLTAYAASLASKLQMHKNGSSVHDMEFEKIKKSSDELVEAAEHHKIQAEREYQNALAARELFERNVVPLFQSLKDITIERSRSYGKALFELELIMKAAQRIQEMQHQDPGMLGEDIVDINVHQPLERFVRTRADLLAMGDWPALTSCTGLAEFELLAQVSRSIDAKSKSSVCWALLEISTLQIRHGRKEATNLILNARRRGS